MLDRHRVTQLIELVAHERAARGPERSLRGRDVEVFLRAAYDDATAPARAKFMERMRAMPSSDWPWSTVQAPPFMQTRGGSGGNVAQFVAMGGAGPVAASSSPPALILLLGQADSIDSDPGDRIPARGTPEAVRWEPLYRALEAWDTDTIQRWIGPVGWSVPGEAPPPRDTDANADGAGDGATAGAPADGGAGAPADGGAAPPSTTGMQPAAGRSRLTYIAAAAGVAAVVGGITVAVRVNRARNLRRLSDAIRAQQQGIG
jgi:hypothetical protein